MDPRLEQNFADLSIPVLGLREHFDRHQGKISLPESLALRDKENVRLDLEAALQAARADDVNWLTGKEIVAEVNNDQSPYHGRSAFRVFSRAAAFESILAGREGRFVPCPNQTIEFFATTVKAIRDEQFRKKLGELFPETVANRADYLKNLEDGLAAARRDNDIDELTGEEVLLRSPDPEANALCNDIESLDLFWQTALVNAWLEGRPTLEVIDISPKPVASLPPATVPPASPKNPPFSQPLTIPWTPSIPVPPIPTPPGTPTPPTIPPTNPLGGLGMEDITWQLGTDAGFGGGGILLQRGLVSEVHAKFEREAVEEGVRPKFVSLNRYPVPADRKGAQIEPLHRDEFLREPKRAKWFQKAEREAELFFKQPDFTETVVTRSMGERGWIRGSFSPRRLAGLGGIVYGLVDAGFRLFRGDGRGLDGPLTDAGVDPLGSRLALMGAGVGAAAVTILTGGLSLVATLVLGGATAVGGGLETYAAIEEEGTLKFESEFIPMRDRDSWLGKPGRSTTQSDLLARLNAPTCKSHRADSYTWDSNRRALKI